MKKILLGLVLMAFASAPAYADPQGRRLLTGAAIGATAGAFIGSQSDDSDQGAVAGAIFGALAGAFIGSIHAESVDYEQPYEYEPEDGNAYHNRHAYEEHREHEQRERQRERYAQLHRYGYGEYGDDDSYAARRFYGHYGYRHDGYADHLAHERHEVHQRHEAQEAHRHHEYIEHHDDHQYDRANRERYGQQRQYYAWMD